MFVSILCVLEKRDVEVVRNPIMLINMYALEKVFTKYVNRESMYAPGEITLCVDAAISALPPLDFLPSCS